MGEILFHTSWHSKYIYETRYCNLYAFSFRTSRSDYGMTDSNTCTKFNVDCRKNKIKCKKLEIGLEYEVVQEHHFYYPVDLWILLTIVLQFTKLTSVSPCTCSVRSPLSNDNVGTLVWSSSFLIKWSCTIDPSTWMSRSYDCGWKLLSVDLLVLLPSVTPTLTFAIKQWKYFELFVNLKIQIKRTGNSGFFYWVYLFRRYIAV